MMDTHHANALYFNRNRKLENLSNNMLVARSTIEIEIEIIVDCDTALPAVQLYSVRGKVVRHM